MKAYVINLDRRPEKWLRTQELWSPWFELERFSAVDVLNDGALGCKLSHLRCAENMPGNVAIILEDDAVPTPYFEQIGMDCLKEVMNFPDAWDFVNLGPYLDCTPIRLERAKLSKSFSPFLLRTTYSQQTHFVCYNRRSLSLLGASIQSKLALDVFLGRHAVDQLVPIHLLATQSDGPSDVSPWVVDKHKHLLYQLSEQMLQDARLKLL